MRSYLKRQRAIIYCSSSSLDDSAWSDAKKIDLLTQKDRQQNLKLFLSWQNWLYVVDIQHLDADKNIEIW